MKVLKNRHKKIAFAEKPDERLTKSIRWFHAALPEYSITPLHSSPEIAGSLGLETLCVKDEAYRFGLKAFKALGASWAIFRYMQSIYNQDLLPVDFLTEGVKQAASGITFTTATDGNHGRGVAWVARLMGAGAVIYMPAGTVPARIKAIEREGAEVYVIDGDYDEAVRRAALEAENNDRVIIADTGYHGYMEIPGHIQQGYYTLFSEIHEQLGRSNSPSPDLVILPGGVGALAAAGIEFLKAYYRECKVWIVEPLCADCLLQSAAGDDGRPVSVTGEGGTIMAGLNCGTPSLTAWDTIRDYTDYFIALEDKWAENAMKTLALGGIISGESGSSGLAALLAVKKEAPELLDSMENVLILNTEGDTDPEKYREITGS